jgi:hypothetical protein
MSVLYGHRMDTNDAQREGTNEKLLTNTHGHLCSSPPARPASTRRSHRSTAPSTHSRSCLHRETCNHHKSTNGQCQAHPRESPGEAGSHAVGDAGGVLAVLSSVCAAAHRACAPPAQCGPAGFPKQSDLRAGARPGHRVSRLGLCAPDLPDMTYAKRRRCTRWIYVHAGWPLPSFLFPSFLFLPQRLPHPHSVSPIVLPLTPPSLGMG